jgi:hypothetical protein
MDVFQAKCHNNRFYEEFCDSLKCAIFSNISILQRADLGRVEHIAVWKLILIYFDSVDNLIDKLTYF